MSLVIGKIILEDIIIRSICRFINEDKIQNG